MRSIILGLLMGCTTLLQAQQTTPATVVIDPTQPTSSVTITGPTKLKLSAGKWGQQKTVFTLCFDANGPYPITLNEQYVRGNFTPPTAPSTCKKYAFEWSPSRYWLVLPVG